MKEGKKNSSRGKIGGTKKRKNKERWTKRMKLREEAKKRRNEVKKGS